MYIGKAGSLPAPTFVGRCDDCCALQRTLGAPVKLGLTAPGKAWQLAGECVPHGSRFRQCYPSESAREKYAGATATRRISRSGMRIQAGRSAANAAKRSCSPLAVSHSEMPVLPCSPDTASGAPTAGKLDAAALLNCVRNNPGQRSDEVNAAFPTDAVCCTARCQTCSMPDSRGCRDSRGDAVVRVQVAGLSCRPANSARSAPAGPLLPRMHDRWLERTFLSAR